ncbi:MAG: DNA-directed RNA polymerase subunit A'' [Candidatus Aenigmarchaeota archaeon]|nr:DNA-directed RNA polymerase subunit A'' [Candidatus Aenigmarchaeota archaeon]
MTEKINELMYQNGFSKKIIDLINENFEKYNPTEKQKKEIIERVNTIYKKILYEPGEAIGVVAAQSISEPATQMTMRTYHASGAVAKQVSLGLPRLIEIVDARRSPSTPLMKVYLKEEFNNKESARKVATKIKETKLKNLVVENVTDLVNSSIEFDIDLKLINDLNIKLESLDSLVKKYIKNYDVEIKENKIILSSKKEATIKDLQKIKLKFFDITVNGITGITHAIVLKEGSEWVITTLGSNIKKVLKIEEIDPRRVVSNDIREIEKNFGIEAARNSIVNELSSTLSDQGLDVDLRHLILVADMMTAAGTIRPIGRYGLSGNKRSVLAKANFETTVKHLTDAAIKGEEDVLDSIIENVIVNQVAPIGTSMCKLSYKSKKVKKK